MYEMTNSQGKKLSLPDAAKKFFGLKKGIKKVMCLPVSGDIKKTPASIQFEYSIEKAKKQKRREGTLIIRMGGLGDLILLSSALRSLRGSVTVATLPQHLEFMKGQGFKCIPIGDAGKYRFDKEIDLRFQVEPQQFGDICKASWEDYTLKDRSDLFEELVGVHPAKKDFTVPVRVDAAESIMSKIRDFDDDVFLFVALNASMSASARSIPPKYIRPLCRKLTKELKVRVALFGQSQPWNQQVKSIAMPGLVNLIDRTDINEMIALIALADVVVTPDTGSLHVAGALKKKTVALFGNINPRTRVSYYPTVKTLYPVGELACVPCWDTHPCNAKIGRGTPCMLALTPDRVVNAVKEIGGFK